MSNYSACTVYTLIYVDNSPLNCQDFFIFINSQHPLVTQMFTHKHRLCFSLPPQPFSAQTDVYFLSTERVCFPLHRFSVKGKKNNNFSCYFILSAHTYQIIYRIIQYMYKTHKHSGHGCYASQSSFIIYAFVSWQQFLATCGCFFLGSCLFAMATLVQIQLIFCWHMPQVFLLCSVSDKIDKIKSYE